MVHCKHNKKKPEPAFHFNYANIRLIQEHAYWVQRDVWLRRVMWSRSYITSQGSMIDMLWNMRQTQNRSFLIDTSIIWNLTIILVQNLTLNPFTHVKYTAVFINYFLRNHDTFRDFLRLIFFAWLIYYQYNKFSCLLTTIENFQKLSKLKKLMVIIHVPFTCFFHTILYLLITCFPEFNSQKLSHRTMLSCYKQQKQHVK